jgi:two-component system CheB/CheR fusion protein
MKDGRRILVIENHPDSAESLCQVLGVWGHAGTFALGGTRGVAHALRSAPDAIIIDLGLPDIDGCKVVQLIRADPRGQALVIIAYSGSAHREEQALEAGCDAFVLKPELDELEALVKMTRIEARQFTATAGSAASRRRSVS